MKNKSIIVIIILLLGLCGSVGYIVYDKLVVDDGVSTESNNIEKTDVKENDSSNVKQLEEKNAVTFMRKINYLNTYFYEHYPIEDTLRLDNADVLKMGEKIVLDSVSTYGGIAGFSGERMRDAVASYFGSDYPLKLEDIKCFVGDGVWLQYDLSNDYYSKVGNHGHGGEGSGRSKAYFQDGTYDKETDTYVIHAKVLSSDSVGELGGPRVRFYDQFRFDQPIYDTQKDEDTDYDVVYKEVSDKLSIVTYTFVKNSDGGYGLKSVEL